MSSAPTINSRLRVLVAKTFRASQLYSSMRTGREEPRNLGELANDVRAKVWHLTHSELQSALNDLLSLPPSEVSTKVVHLKLKFEKASSRAEVSLEKGIERLVESAERREFATSLKSSVELVRLKAEMQANRVIADELAEILSGRSKGVEKELKSLEETESEKVDSKFPSNVVPLRRRSGSKFHSF